MPSESSTLQKATEMSNTMTPPSSWERLKRALIGTPETTQTRMGPVEYRRGGIPGLISKASGGAPLAMPGTIGVSDEPLSEASAIHEQFGHKQGRAGGYDFKQRLANPDKDLVKKFGFEKQIAADPFLGEFLKPSEIYAYTTQPMELSANDMSRVRALMQNPEYRAFFEQHKNPNTDWDFNKMTPVAKPTASAAVTNDPAFQAFLEKQRAMATGQKQ